MASEARSKAAIPVELRAAPPRKVRRYRKKTSSLLILPYLIVGIVVIAYLAGELILLQATAAQPGRISQLDPASPGSARRAEYQYVIGSTIYKGSDQVSERTFESLKVGMIVPIHVFAIGPYHFRELETTSGDYWATHWVLWALAVVWNLVVFLAIKARGIPKRLVRIGTAVFGQVTDTKPSPRSKSGTQVHYEYRSGSGQLIVANDLVTGIRPGDISKGQDVVVLFRIALFNGQPRPPARSRQNSGIRHQPAPARSGRIDSR
ncbi:MAG: hypothetical protein ABSF29_13480 [Tepidisphaeraceae bacterium]